MMHCNVFYHIHALFLLYLCLISFLLNFVSFLKETIEFNCATENSWLHGLSLKYNQLNMSLPLKKTECLPYNSEKLPAFSLHEGIWSKLGQVLCLLLAQL